MYDFEGFGLDVDFDGTFSEIAPVSDGATMTVTRSGGLSFDVIFVSLIAAASTGTGAPPGWGQVALSPFNEEGADDFFVAQFSQPISSLSLEMSDFGDDSPDFLVLEVYSSADATGTPLATEAGSWSSSIPDATSLSWNSSGGQAARSARFRGGSSDFPNSMYVDNVSVTLAIPEPAGLLLVGLTMVVGVVSKRG